VIFAVAIHTAVFAYAAFVTKGRLSLMPGLLCIDYPIIWLAHAAGLPVTSNVVCFLLGTLFHGLLGWMLGTMQVRYRDWWRRDNDPLVCTLCGYDLRGQTVDRCPECFTPFERP